MITGGLATVAPGAEGTIESSVLAAAKQHRIVLMTAWATRPFKIRLQQVRQGTASDMVTLGMVAGESLQFRPPTADSFLIVPHIREGFYGWRVCGTNLDTGSVPPDLHVTFFIE